MDGKISSKKIRVSPKAPANCGKYTKFNNGNKPHSLTQQSKNLESIFPFFKLNEEWKPFFVHEEVDEDAEDLADFDRYMKEIEEYGLLLNSPVISNTKRTSSESLGASFRDVNNENLEGKGETLYADAVLKKRKVGNRHFHDSISKQSLHDHCSNDVYEDHSGLKSDTSTIQRSTVKPHFTNSFFRYDIPLPSEFILYLKSINERHPLNLKGKSKRKPIKSEAISTSFSSPTFRAEDIDENNILKFSNLLQDFDNKVFLPYPSPRLLRKKLTVPVYWNSQSSLPDPIGSGRHSKKYNRKLPSSRQAFYSKGNSIESTCDYFTSMYRTHQYEDSENVYDAFGPSTVDLEKVENSKNCFTNLENYRIEFAQYVMTTSAVASTRSNTRYNHKYCHTVKMIVKTRH